MTEQTFSLIPFPATDIPAIEITGTVSLENTLLTIQYFLRGAIQDILLPQTSTNPRRKADLWKTTCFEFFLAIKDQPPYWEFNLSPSGDWNVYRMEAYRRIDFEEETAISRLPLARRDEPNGFLLDLSVDVAAIIKTEPEIEMGITAVIQTKNSSETYWALTHPASQADFHLRESFILALAGQTPPAKRSALVG